MYKGGDCLPIQWAYFVCVFSSSELSVLYLIRLLSCHSPIQHGPAPSRIVGTNCLHSAYEPLSNEQKHDNTIGSGLPFRKMLYHHICLGNHKNFQNHNWLAWLSRYQIFWLLLSFFRFLITVMFRSTRFLAQTTWFNGYTLLLMAWGLKYTFRRSPVQKRQTLYPISDLTDFVPV